MHHIAILFWQNLKKTGFIEIVTLAPSIEDAAFIISKQNTDKDFSLTDCTSFSIMRSRKLKSGFAFDKHFEQFEGISLLP